MSENTNAEEVTGKFVPGKLSKDNNYFHFDITSMRCIQDALGKPRQKINGLKTIIYVGDNIRTCLL